MTSQRSSLLEAMTTTDILTRAVRLYRGNLLRWLRLVAPGAAVWLACFLFIGGLRYRALQAVSDGATEPVSGMVPTILFAEFMLFLLLFVSYGLTAAGTVAISEQLLGRESDVGPVYRRLLEMAFPLLGSLLLAAVAIAIGLYLFALPGILAYVWFCLTPSVVMIEGEGGFGALRRSRVVIKGDFEKGFFTVGWLAIIEILIIAAAHSLPNLLGGHVSFYLISAFLTAGLLLFIEPLRIGATTLLYYDLRVRKEGYDLRALADELAALP